MIKPQDRKKVLEAIRAIRNPIERRMVVLKIAYSEATDSVRRNWLRDQIVQMYERFGKPRGPRIISEVENYEPMDEEVGFPRGTMKPNKLKREVKKMTTKNTNPKMWMQNAFGKNPGALHRHLDIPLDTNMGEMKTLLERFKKGTVGSTIKNPLKIGKPQYRVTLLRKREANLALLGIRKSQARSKKGNGK